MKILFFTFEPLYFSPLSPDGGVISSVFAASRLLFTYLALSGTKQRNSAGPGCCPSLLWRVLLQAGEVQAFLSDLVALCP